MFTVKSVGKFKENARSCTSKERKNAFAGGKTQTSIPRSSSALDQIKDQDYEKQMEEKERRVKRLKDSRRKYSKQKLKCKRDDSSQNTGEIQQKNQAKPSFMSLKDNGNCRKKKPKTEDKENLAPVNVRITNGHLGFGKTNSTSMLIIPRMKNIDSKLTKKEKQRKEERNEYYGIHYN